MSTARTTRDPDEIARFDALARDWWNPAGPMKPLHAIHPTRMRFVAGEIERYLGGGLVGRPALDVGCGGGIVAESLAKMGLGVTAIDAAAEAIAIARAHAAAADLAIDYQVTTVEELAATGARFDVITALEVVEHVADPALFVASLARLLSPGGVLVLSTLNRTPQSFALGIVAAEYVLRWVPRGTHDWRKFVRPAELAAAVRGRGLALSRAAGLVPDLRRGGWRLDPGDLSVNYLLSAHAPAA